MKITSLTNHHIKELVKLHEKKNRDQTHLFLIEGSHLIEEAKKYNIIKEIITDDESIKADTYVTKEIMKKISQQESSTSMIAVCQKLEEKEIQNRVLVLDGIQDPGNLGTMIRSAVAFSFTDIVLSNNTVDLYNDKVIRASEGMLFSINIIRTDLESFLHKYKDTYQILATDVKIGKNIKEIKITEPLMLIIGNEGQGISEISRMYGNTFLKIPMSKTCESLNASVSASILMYEMSEKL